MDKNRLDELLEQNYSSEFQPLASQAPPTPPATHRYHSPGAVGEYRHLSGRSYHPNQLWVVPLMVERAPAPPPATPPPVAPSPPPRRRPARVPPPPRRAPLPAPHPPQRAPCCSFCYKVAAQWAAEQEVQVPSKDDYGYWSSHSLMGRYGVVVCPVLRRVVCGHCGATGDHAHTTRFHEQHWEQFE
ncbi:hypothetical protein CAEBREN_13963 [Caenorhabditis brenneri]|uniref:Nanos-type domain-containing protein n=1 Tax=Caenorhabditis brenneri TaxID=135651 RepID=G0P9V4_CAEBE|nr:hypothetical protein CAEBREN_13963 [Caenorhabditis brenneri]